MIEEQVSKAIQEVRPQLQADGGDIELVKVTPEGKVLVRLTGACFGCPMSQLTLKQGVEKHLKSTIPEVTSVESV